MNRTIDSESLWRLLWAKTDRDEPERWHPLANHLTDVAAVAIELWETVISPSEKARWTAFCGSGDVAAGNFLAFLAGLHDLGKASPVFQAASPEQRSRLLGAGVSLPTVATRNAPRHGAITASTLGPLLRERNPELRPRQANRLAIVSGIHHGSMFDRQTLRLATPRVSPDEIGDEMWDTARRDLFNRVVDALGALPEIPTIPTPVPLALWAAGFISAADWIGSNTEWFPFRPLDAGGAAGLERSRRSASMALRELGWEASRIELPSSFEAAFAYQQWDGPNETQQTVIDAVESMSGPGVIVVEAPMGGGKTEAAFWVATHAERNWGTRGLYIGMPTRASSDQLFGRLRTFLAAHHPGPDQRLNLMLLHGHAALGAAMKQARANDKIDTFATSSGAPDVPGSDELAAEWFGGRKRGLLAPYGVGTVDQTLLAILENRHHFVRLHGLAGKTVIFDEVHAYDVYMETLFARELELLGAMGVPVVILTATLPANRRDALLAAYANGAGWAVDPDPEPAAYPRVTTIDASAIRSRAIPFGDVNRKVALRWHSGSDVEVQPNVATELAERLANGGVAAVICNTVRQAQAMYMELANHLPADELTLFHARFRLGDRERIQESVLSRFGKPSPSTYRPRRHVVVATQVIEQSLDLDFDLMVSYFCPTDLLLQRAGRMHRHTRARPAGLGKPELWVMGVGNPDDTDYPALGVPLVSRLVYEPHVLVRSLAALRDRDTIILPGDISNLVESSYAQDATPPADLATDWERSRTAWRDRLADDTREAERRMVKPLLTDDLDAGNDWLVKNIQERVEEDDAGERAAESIARTRLGPPSVDIVLLHPEEVERLQPESDSGDHPLPPARVAEFLLRSVSITQRGPYRKLIAQEPFPAWKRTSWLKHHRLVILDESGTAHVDTYRLALDDALGLVIDNASAVEEEE